MQLTAETDPNFIESKQLWRCDLDEILTQFAAAKYVRESYDQRTRY